MSRNVKHEILGALTRNANPNELAGALVRCNDRLEAAEAWAAHQEWCRSCAEDSLGSCVEGTELRRAWDEKRGVER